MDKGLTVIQQDGTIAAVHYGLCVVASGLAMTRPVGLFITMQACSLFCVREDGGPGWHDLGVSPGPSGNMTAQQYDDAVRDTGMAGIEELLRSCDSLGCRFLVCEAGLQFWRMSERLRPDLSIERTGIASIVAESDMELLFI